MPPPTPDTYIEEQHQALPNLKFLLTHHLQQLVPLVQWVSLSLGAPRAWLTVKGRGCAFKISCNGSILENLGDALPLFFDSQSTLLEQPGSALLASAYLDSEPSPMQSHRVCGWAMSIEPLGATASIGMAHDAEFTLAAPASEIMRLATASISNSLCQLYEVASREPLSLRATQAKLELALAASQIGIIEIDFSTRHLAFDRQLGQLYGYGKSVRGSIQQLWTNRVHPGDLAKAVGALRNAVPDASGQALIDTEYRIIALDGTVRDLQAKGLIQFNKQGKPDHLIGAQWDVTEQKQNQRAMSSRNAQLQDAYDYIELAKSGVGIGVGEFNLLKKSFSIDSTTAELFGLTSPVVDVPYATWAQLLPPEVLQRVEAEALIFLKDATQDIGKLKYSVVLKDGRRRELQWVYRIFRDDKGYAIRMLGCGWDITPEVERLEALKRTQSLLIEMENLGNIGAWSYDPQNGLLDWTDQVYRIVGSNLDGPMKLEEAAARYCLPESRIQLLSAFRDAAENGTGWDLVLELETEEKVRKWVKTRGKAIRGPDGTITRLIGSVRDVTREVDEQRERLQQQMQLQNCLDQMQMGILVFTPEKLVFANASFRLTIGLKKEDSLEVINPFAITSSLDHKFLAQRYASALQGEVSVAPLVIDVYALDGSSTPCLTTVSPITWDGKTHLLAAVAPLREADMLRTVIRTTQERYDRQLVDEIEELQFNVARELHDLVGSKLAGVSMVFAGLAARTPSLQQYLIPTQTQLQEVAESTRSLARGLMPVDNAPGSFWRALERSCHEYKSTTDIRCTFVMRGNFDDIDSQAGGHLYRIALEAMSNAIKHGEAKMLNVTLKRRGTACLMEITDNGHGVGSDLQRPGTGIGMRSMRARAQAIGGVLNHNAQPEGGITVTVKWKAEKLAVSG